MVTEDDSCFKLTGDSVANIDYQVLAEEKQNFVRVSYSGGEECITGQGNFTFTLDLFCNYEG